MSRKKNRAFLLMVTICSTAGVVLGGTASWAESNSCLQSDQPTADCLTQNPVRKTVEGMGFGLVAGLGAAIGATWQAKRQG